MSSTTDALRDDALKAVLAVEGWKKANPDVARKVGDSAKLLIEGAARTYLGGWAIQRLVNAVTPLRITRRQGRGVYVGISWIAFAINYNYVGGAWQANRVIDRIEALES